MITIEDFSKIEARVGKVLIAEAVPDSDKLIRFELDFGVHTNETGEEYHDVRQILSAIRQWYPDPAVLIGKSLLFCVNLAPRKMRGLESHGMLMAVDGEDGVPVFLVPDAEVRPGAKVH
jgi:methionyl-tRNA synthetase